MAEPIAIGATVIGALVALMSKYMEYRATVETAKKNAQPEPAKSPEISQGEAALATVQTAITQQGNVDEQEDLKSFERNPQRNAENLARALRELAVRSQPFAQQLQSLAQGASIQTGGIQGTVIASDDAKINQAIGVNTGTATYNAPADDQ